MPSTSAKRLNRTALPSITGFDASAPDIAQAEHGGAVGDDRDQIALGGVVVDGRRVFLDAQAGRGDAGRIGQRQVALGGQRLGGCDFQLAGASTRMEKESLFVSDALILVGHTFPLG